MALKSAQKTSSRHILGRKTLFQTRYLFTIFFYDRWFSHTILCVHKLSHTPLILSLGACAPSCSTETKHTWSEWRPGGQCHVMVFNDPTNFYIYRLSRVKLYFKLMGSKGIKLNAGFGQLSLKVKKIITRNKWLLPLSLIVAWKQAFKWAFSWLSSEMLMKNYLRLWNSRTSKETLRIKRT